MERKSGVVKKKCLKYRFLNPGCDTTVPFIDKTGFGNPYVHLKACYGKGEDQSEQDKKLKTLYEKARKETAEAGRTSLSHFATQSSSEYDKAMFSYINVIVNKNLPIHFVQDPVIRQIHKFDVHICRYTLNRVIIELVKLVESKIEKEINENRGSVLFDAWSAADIHYVAVMASFCRKIHSTGTAVELVLLAISPLPQPNIEANESEATRFTAEAHELFFENTFSFYN